MVTAIRSGSVVDESGVPHEIEPGLTRWSTNCPELADPKVAAMFGLAVEEPTERSAWSERPPKLWGREPWRL